MAAMQLEPELDADPFIYYSAEAETFPPEILRFGLVAH